MTTCNGYFRFFKVSLYFVTIAALYRACQYCLLCPFIMKYISVFLLRLWCVCIFSTKIEKEKREHAKQHGMIRTEITGAEIAEEMEKERRLFQLQMCEVSTRSLETHH